MDRTEYLKEQIARCERLTKSILDELTVERLLALAAQCRGELASLMLPKVEKSTT
jgi:hypothetical protein